VLPLKRFCPRWLNFPALVIGSISPDSAYLFGRLKLDEVSHRLWGMFAFCLPAGLLLTLLLYLVRSGSADFLPPRYRRLLLPETWQAAGSLIAIAVSVLIGSGTHLVWDALTHPSDWAVEALPVFQVPITSFAGHNVRICRLLWYLSSFAGIAVVYFVYCKAQRRVDAEAGRTLGNLRWLQALLVGAIVLPIELLHDLIPNPAGTWMVAALSFLMVLGVAWVNSRSTSGQPCLKSSEANAKPAMLEGNYTRNLKS